MKGVSAKDLASLAKQAADFRPVLIFEVELSRALPNIANLNDSNGLRYHQAQCLVRLHSQPLGVVELDLLADGLNAEDYAPLIWRALGQEINIHLQQDGLGALSSLEAAGLPTPNLPHCLRARGQFLASAPFVSVVVCTKDRTERLATCLPALLAQQYPHYEIIIVDNAPQTSATADLISQSYGHLRQLRYVREDRPGVSWARNRGLQEAQGDFIAYTDDDVVTDSHWLASLMMAFQLDENVGCVTGLTLPAEFETPAQVWFEQFCGFSRGYSRIVHNIHSRRMADPLYPFNAVKYGSGVNIAFDTSTLRRMGGFDPALGLGTTARGGEDLAVYHRLTTSGYTMVYEPLALVRHFHRRDHIELCRQVHDYGVGFTAFIVDSIVGDPKRFFELLGKSRHGLRALFSPESPRHTRRSSAFPSQLNRIELKGMLNGPLAYVDSQWHTRRVIKQFGRIEVKSMAEGPDPNTKGISK